MNRDEDKSVRALPISLAATADNGPLDFLEVLQSADADPHKWAELDEFEKRMETEKAQYSQALRALEQGNESQAEELLRICAQDQVGEADYLLAELLRTQGRDGEARPWYQRALQAGDQRARAALDDLASAIDGESAPPSQEQARWIWKNSLEKWKKFTINGFQPIEYSPPPAHVPECPSEQDLPDETSMPELLLERELLIHYARRIIVTDTRNCRSEGSPPFFFWNSLKAPATTAPLLPLNVLLLPSGQTPFLHAFLPEALRSFTRSEEIPCPLRDYLSWCLVQRPDIVTLNFASSGTPVVYFADCNIVPHSKFSLIPPPVQEKPKKEHYPQRRPGYAQHIMAPLDSLEPIDANATIHEAARIFTHSNHPALPVIDNGMYSGVVRMRDLMEILYRSGPRSIARVGKSDLIKPFVYVSAEARSDELLQHVNATDDLVAIMDAECGLIGFITGEVLLEEAKRHARTSEGPTTSSAPTTQYPSGPVLLRSS